MAAQFLSTAKAAKVLGVSVSTVKRWVDDGILLAQKTAGGHRKLAHADVLRMVKSGLLPAGDLTELQCTSSFSPRKLASDLFFALLRGDSGTATRIVMGAYNSRITLPTMADEIIAPAMHRIGHEWATGDLDVYQEHRGSQACATALYSLKSHMQAAASSSGPSAVGAAPEGDLTLLPCLLAELVMMDLGWKPVNLGPNTPLSSFEKAVREIRPKLIWLSASHIIEPARFLEEYRGLQAAAQQIGSVIVIGGRAMTEDVRCQLAYTAFGDRLAQLASIASAIYRRHDLPRRGRPRKEV